MVLAFFFNGKGDISPPTFINLFCFWPFEIPLAWMLLCYFDWGPLGAIWAVMSAFSVLAVVSGATFRRGRWKRVFV